MPTYPSTPQSPRRAEAIKLQRVRNTKYEISNVPGKEYLAGLHKDFPSRKCKWQTAERPIHPQNFDVAGDDPEDRMTIFRIPADHWSDGTEAPLFRD